MGRESLALLATPTAASPAKAVAAAKTATALAPGFRFHPTDEELVSYYLKRKVLNRPVRFDAIGEVDIYKHEPWELAVYSRLKTRDQEWYFFSALDKKYGNGARMNRATNKGYWKATGKDREIRRDSQLLGMKKTLVFHSGRAPDGLRTNWVMHEYRLTDCESELITAGIQDAYVLCRVFHKSNIGPPSGNRYAPFLEEEWDEGEMILIPGGYVQEPKSASANAKGSNKIQQESPLNKDLININELPRESRIDEQLKKHPPNGRHQHDKQENGNTCNHPDSFFKRERPNEEEDGGHGHPLCVLNKEAPLPIIQYKRRRQNDSNGSSRSTQEHCSSTTTVDTMLTSSAATTAISALLEFSLMGSVDRKEKPTGQKEVSILNNEEDGNHHQETSMPPSCANLISELQKEIHQMAVERETFKLEMMSAEAMISILQSRIDALRQENEELRSCSSSSKRVVGT